MSAEDAMPRLSPSLERESVPLVGVSTTTDQLTRAESVVVTRVSNGTVNRWTRLFIGLCIFLLMSGFVLMWGNQDYSALNFYYNKFTGFPEIASTFPATTTKTLPIETSAKQPIQTSSRPVQTSSQPLIPTTTHSSSLPYHTQKPWHESSFLHNWTHYDKFMLTDVGGGACGGVGNMIFRLASLYGIGKQINRTACLQGSCAQEYHIELYSMFPNLQKFPLLTHCWDENTKGVGFAGNCWNYDNVSKLNEHKDEKFINLQTSYLQSHLFFHHSRRDILFMFNFSSGMDEMVDAYAQHLFDSDNSIKICAHMRRGDFNGGHPLLPTEEAFLIPAMKFLIKSVMNNQTTPNVDVLLLSDDIYYANDIREKIKKLELTDKVYVSRDLNRIENLNLGARHCDYMLVSSSGSTFGWWMAYLMPDEKQQNVYYNSLFFKPEHTGQAAGFHEGDFFPSEWNRLVLNKEKKEVFVEDRQKPVIAV
ncbi:hypothetical protein M3Y95_00855900 [Aphelenchoides besseyi]|nr:hypothetical protein M3Y95_00855900 [Aphelenchoides besseyi]